MAFGSLGSIWAEIGLNTRKLDEGLMAANLKLATADKTISGYGQKLTAASTKMMIAGGLMVGAVAAVGIASVKMAAQFETSMRNVNSISKLSETQFKALGQSVIDMSKKFPQTAKELADGLYDIASSGFQGAAGLKVLEASAKAASAGMTTTAVSAKGITAVLNAYGLEAEEAAAISDTMFKTVDKGIITFEELSSTVGDWVGMGRAAGLEFNELSGAIAYMTTKGISAAEAGTSMQRMLVGIIKPTEDMAAVIHNAGFESGEMMLKTLGLTDTMKVLNDATGGSITKLIDLIPQIRGVRGANALLGAGYEELTDYMEDFKDTTGATDIALAEQSKALNFQLQILKNNATAIAITLGNKYIPSITSTVKKLSEWISENEDATVTIINLGMAVIGAGGGVLLLAAAFGKLRAIMLAHPIGATIAGFAALNIAADTGAKKLEAMDTVWGTLGGTLLRTLAPLTSVIKGFKDNITVAKALADGTIELSDVKNLNVFTMGKEIEKIEELRAAQEESTEVTDKAIETIEKYRDIFPEATLEIDKLGRQLEIGVINQTEYDDAVEETVKNIKEYILITKTLNSGEAERLGLTVKLTERQKELIKELGLTEEAMEALGIETVDTTDDIDDQTDSVDDLRGAFNDLIGTLFDGINANNELQEAEWEQIAAQKEVNRLIEEGKQGTEEYEKALNGLDAADQKVIDSQYKVYTSIYTTKEEQESARKKAIEYGLQLVTTGEWGEEALASYLEKFGVTEEQISKIAAIMNGKLNYATRLRRIMVILDASDVPPKVFEAQRVLDSLKDKDVKITVKYKYESYEDKYGSGAMGGIVGHMAMGGIVGPGIPQAASGMVVPQMGREIPILAHEGEMILNDSQQGNLINALWGVANGKGSPSGTGDINIHFNEPVYIREEADIDRVATALYDKVKIKQIGAGIR